MRQAILQTLIIIFGFLAVFGLSSFLEKNAAPLPTEIVEADLAFKAETLKRYSFGFDGLIADYYWMTALQYIGRKLINNENVQLDDLKPLNPRLLYPMLDTATTLDPDFTVVYSYGSTVLPAVSVEDAIKISEKGINAQPDNWRMYHHLGFIHWKNNDFKKAGEVYAKGATKPDAPFWMTQMSARMEAEGGSRTLAREIYRQIYENAQDEKSKEQAAKRLMQVDSFDERDAIRAGLQVFQQKINRCAENWREAFPILQTAKLPNNTPLRFTQKGEPLDPSGTTYRLVNSNGKCDIDLDWSISKVPYK